MRDLISLLWRGKWKIAGSALLGLAAGITVAVFSTPIYRSTVVVSVSAEEQGSALRSMTSGIGQLAALAGVQLGGGSQRNEFVAFLGARGFTMRYIVAHDLKPHLFPQRWDSANQTWKSADEPIPTLEDAYMVFDREVRSIKEDKSTGLLSLSIDAPDPQLAAQWANDLVQMANMELRERAKTQAEQSIAFLQQELGNANPLELRQAIFGLLESQMTTIMLANARKDYAFRIVDPAMPSDGKRFIRPRKLLTAVLGMLLGGLFAAFSIVLYETVRSRLQG